MKHVNIRFPDELHEAALAAANAERRPLGAWIRNLVQDALSPPASSTSVTEVAPEGSTWNAAKPLHRDTVEARPKRGAEK